MGALKAQHPNATVLPSVLRVPSKLSSELVFEDYGIGMSFDTVWEVFSQYGNSTKNLTNDEVGGFGLGSKAAFCYNDGAAWTIESRFAGECHTFTAYVGEDLIPTLAHVGTVPSSAHTGITIKIPIRREDTERVRDAVVKYAPFFSLPLQVDSITMPEGPDYVFRAPGWAIERKTHTWHNGRLTVVIGDQPPQS